MEWKEESVPAAAVLSQLICPPLVADILWKYLSLRYDPFLRQQVARQREENTGRLTSPSTNTMQRQSWIV